MSDIHICPTCNARAKKVRTPGAEDYQLKAVQDDDAFAKINQLKQMLEKEKSRNAALKEKIASLQA